MEENSQMSPFSTPPPGQATLRVGILFNAASLAPNESQLLEDLLEAVHLHVAAIAIRAPTPGALVAESRSLSRRVLEGYKRADVRRYGRPAAASREVDAYRDRLDKEAIINVTGRSDEELITELTRRDLDVILCCRPFERMADFAGCAAAGIWWIGSTGRPSNDRDYLQYFLTTSQGSLPMRTGLWAIFPKQTDAVLIECGSTRLISRISVVKNLEPTTPLQRNLWFAGLRRLLVEGLEQLRKEAVGRAAELEAEMPAVPIPETIAISTMGRALVRMAVRDLRYRIRYWKRIEQWQVGIRVARGREAWLTNPDGYRWLTAPAGHWYADPFLFSCGDGDYLFMEDFDENTNRGQIVCGRLDSQGNIEAVAVVLQKPYHLSYPHVFEHAGDIFMIPETGFNNTVELYRAVSFPWKWELVKVLYRGPVFDTTTLFFEDRFWFFTSLITDEGDHCSQLLLFHSGRLDGDWTLHTRSPISSDAKCARGAGQIIEQGSRLIRPAQDGSQTYGGATRFYLIETLNERQYVESDLGLMMPGGWPNAVGLHTYNRSKSMEAIDRRVIIPKV